ncbi:MAG: hypothetical protein Q9167_007056 [Letrouitia subvulpina]
MAPNHVDLKHSRHNANTLNAVQTGKLAGNLSQRILAAKARQRANFRKHQRWLEHQSGPIRRSISKSFDFEEQLRSQNLLPLAAEKPFITDNNSSSGQETAEAVQNCSNQHLTPGELVFTKKEIPNSQPSDDQEAQPSTVPTIVLPQIEDTPAKREHPYKLRLTRFLSNGRLPREVVGPIKINMDDSATQPATQIHGRPLLSPKDEVDVLCILHPSSLTAYKAVQLVAETSPQHILQNEGLSQIFSLAQESPTESTTKADEQLENPSDFDHPVSDINTLLDNRSPLSIALRLSSRLNNPGLGFCFGRGRGKCDLLISTQEEQMKISNMHFRIFLTKHGTMMLHDTSTNGTIVDNIPLGNKLNPKLPVTKPSPRQDQRLIDDGSIIELLTSKPTDTMRFIVQVPERGGQRKKWERKLAAYTQYLEQLKRKAKAYEDAIAEGVTPLKPPVSSIPPNHFRRVAEMLQRPMPQPDQILQEERLSPFVSHNLTAATEPFRYGMSWNGGDSYKVTGSIGKGAFASVYKVVRKDNGEAFAAKELEKRRFMKDNMATGSKIHTELSIMKKIQHPNIVQYVDQHEDETHLIIIMELVPYGDLRPYVEGRHNPMIEYNGKTVALQMCQALEYLHARNITHRDIKPDNILIQSEDPLFVKLSDFGLSKVVNDEETFLRSFCGTLLYCAPEVYPEFDQKFNAGNQTRLRPRHGKGRPKQPYTKAVDVWGLAAVLYHLLCGKPPFPASLGTTGFSMLTQIMNHSVDYGKLKHAGVTDEGIDFLSRMLVVDPKLRMTDTECLDHPWFFESTGRSSGPLIEGEGDAAMAITVTGVPKSNATEKADDELDASYLSLQDQELDDEMADSGEELVAEVGGNASQSHASKRFISSAETDQNQSVHEYKRMRNNHDATSSSLDEYSLVEVDYPSLSEIHRDPGQPQNQTAAGNRLFGEISQSALKSSGVLGWNANAALGMVPDGRDDLSSSSNYDGSRYFVTDVGRQQQLQMQRPMPQNGRTSGGSAPSLFGTEALVGRMNMDSDIAATRPATPKTREETPQRSFHDTGSTSAAVSQDSDGLYSASPRQPRNKHTEDTDFYHGSIDLNTQQHNAPETDFQRRKDIASQANRSTHRQDLQTAIEVSKGSSDQPAASLPKESSTFPQTTATPRPEIAKPPPPLSNSQQSSNSSRSQNPDLLPPRSTRLSPKNFTVLATLTTTPSSLLSQKLSLTARITTYGRSPQDTYTYPNNLDPRCPKNAFEITFWRPGLERKLSRDPGLEMTKYKDLEALITSRSTKGVLVNGVRVCKGDGGWCFGRLRTGDVVSVFGAEEDGKSAENKAKEKQADDKGATKAAGGKFADDRASERSSEKSERKSKEHLTFRVEIHVGKGKSRRKEGEEFKVEKEVEKFKADLLRRSQVEGSSTAAAAATTITTTDKARAENGEGDHEAEADGDQGKDDDGKSKNDGRRYEGKGKEKQKEKRRSSHARSEAAWSTTAEAGGDGDTQMMDVGKK